MGRERYGDSMKAKRIYISGPISGRPVADAVEKFDEVADAIKETGNIPVNPVDMAGWRLDWKTYMQLAQVILFSGQIDRIYMLAGWDKSHGACLERYYARLAGIPVSYQR